MLLAANVSRYLYNTVGTSCSYQSNGLLSAVARLPVLFVALVKWMQKVARCSTQIYIVTHTNPNRIERESRIGNEAKNPIPWYVQQIYFCFVDGREELWTQSAKATFLPCSYPAVTIQLLVWSKACTFIRLPKLINVTQWVLQVFVRRQWPSVPMTCLCYCRRIPATSKR